MFKKLLNLLFVRKKNRNVYYIHGNDALPKPLSAEEELKTYFMIPSKNQILYVYELSVNNENK